jgi:hypothetical protein
MMENAESEPVKLKAATEILDRAGVRGGTELSVDVEVNDARPPHVIVAERLQRLAAGAASVYNVLTPEETPTDVDTYEITDAVIVSNPAGTPEKIETVDDSGTQAASTDDE